ncbi:phage N-6-adenine-methyltransferase [Halohasta litorea]|uniref:Phage N-6-adenine-methyltransferase n=1 Tax=Halohasta litorea TaxID=869891 RepID=A0ABD6D7W3_9EURY|nr:phage N-6-adenine-methyltransferase [Halohasta litorea]
MSKTNKKPRWLDERLREFMKMKGSNEKGTPPEIIEPLKRGAGGYDLDAATNKEITHIAENYYTKSDDGLSQQWFGKVFVNPPYSREKKKWVAKAREELTKDRVEFIVFLCRGDSSTNWWHGLFEDASYVCFHNQRVSFIGADSTARFPSHIYVLGEPPAKLVDEMNKLGAVVKLSE